MSPLLVLDKQSTEIMPFGLKGMWAEAASKAFASVDGDFDPASVEEAYIGSLAFGGSQLGNTAALLTVSIQPWMA